MSTINLLIWFGILLLIELNVCFVGINSGLCCKLMYICYVEIVSP